MRNIIIVDAVSTGYNLVEDVRRRGFTPIVLESPEEEPMRENSYRMLYSRPEIIKASEDYADTLKMVSKYDPLLVIPGTEQGVGLSTRLSSDLGLLGNPIENIDAMTKKDAMHEALKKAGIRYIRGKVVQRADEALSFMKECKIEKAVVKPLQSAGSQGVFMCNNTDEVKDAVDTILTYKDIYGRKIEKALVQEMIVGTEYIVNTISCNGRHALTSIHRYSKVKTPEGGIIYDYSETINHLEQGNSELVEYAFKVADAIGYKYGIIHGEYMVDENGPVLIEVNCHPMGATQTDEYLDLIFGQHESDSMLDAYLDPEGFRLKINKPYRPFRKGVLKFIMVPKDMEVEDHPICVVARQLRSVNRISVSDSLQPVYYNKTRDLETSGGIIYLVHDDENVVMSDLEILRETEEKYFSLLLSDGMSRRWFANSDVSTVDFEQVLKDCDCHGAILLAGDTKVEIEGAQAITPQTLDEAHKGFDFCVIGYQLTLLDLNESACLELIFKTMDMVKTGGKVIIPQSTYEYLSYKREGAELLMRIKNLSIQAPPACLCGYVIGYKED